MTDSQALRILHIADDLTSTNTGVAASVRQLAFWQSRHYGRVGIHTVDVDSSTIDGPMEIRTYQANGKTPNWHYPQGGVQPLLKWIDTFRPTHLHVHEFWRAAFVLGMLASRLRKIPVVLTAHGLTAPAALGNQGWPRRLKKSAYWNLFARQLMTKDCRLHAITPLESEHFSSFFYRPADAVIPNAIDLDSFPTTPSIEVLRPTKTILFLGRLHPIKGVDLLIEAFAASSLDTSWELLIAGPEEIPEFVAKLKRMAAEAAPRRIRFLGHCSGEKKMHLLASAWVLVVPSHSEVIGMVNLEAAAMCTPSITTHATGLTDWENFGGKLIEPGPGPIIKALEEAAGWSMHERLARGNSMRKLVEDKFSLTTVGEQWTNFYNICQ
jgi:glycosyltransferase involved in cell wall biosynthesis